MMSNDKRLELRVSLVGKLLELSLFNSIGYREGRA